MNDFLTNILRYPRFFITSLTGLILIILTPFKNLVKVPKLRFFLMISFSLFCILIFLIIKNMTGL